VTALKAPTHPDMVSVKQDYFSGEVTYRIAGKKVDPDNIRHIKGFSIPGRPTGLGPIDYARTTFGLGLAQQEYASRFFSQGAQANTVITFPDDKSEDEVNEALDIWRSHHQGLYNAHQPGVLTNGGSIESISVTPEQAQFLQSRQFQVTEVARLFRTPPWMVADVEKSTSWGTGIESQGIHFASFTLRSPIRRVERLFTGLLPPRQYARMNIAALVRADLLTRLEAYERGRNAGLWNIDEIRALEDLPPLPDNKGEDHLAPLNYAPVGAGAGTMPKKPAPAPASGGGEGE
jgi:HK97 family phage portal protein